MPQTGELEERDIRLDVQEPPSWVIQPSDTRGVELEKVEFRCEALGSPPPAYTWVDKEGIDATQKEGEQTNQENNLCATFLASVTGNKTEASRASEYRQKSFPMKVYVLTGKWICKTIYFHFLGWKLDETTGTLTAFKLERWDAGEYTCIAENNAGRMESSAVLSVVIKPHVQELYNHTYPVDKERATITCKASGDPLPKLIWRKWSRK